MDSKAVYFNRFSTPFQHHTYFWQLIIESRKEGWQFNNLGANNKGCMQKQSDPSVAWKSSLIEGQERRDPPCDILIWTNRSMKAVFAWLCSWKHWNIARIMSEKRMRLCDLNSHTPYHKHVMQSKKVYLYVWPSQAFQVTVFRTLKIFVLCTSVLVMLTVRYEAMQLGSGNHSIFHLLGAALQLHTNFIRNRGRREDTDGDLSLYFRVRVHLALHFSALAFCMQKKRGRQIECWKCRVIKYLYIRFQKP